MNSEQKMREALQAAYEAHKDDFEQPWLSLAAEALAAPAGEQVWLTDEEIFNVAVSVPWGLVQKPHSDEYVLAYACAVIAAHEAKRNGGAA